MFKKNMDTPYLPNCHVFVFDGKSLKLGINIWLLSFKAIRLWDIIDKGFVELLECIALTAEAFKELKNIGN